MARVAIIQRLQAPLNTAWAVIRDFAHVNRWVDDVKAITVKGSGLGAVRKLVLQGGLTVYEKLLKLDDENHVISYGSTDTELPFTDYVAVITLREISSLVCDVSWISTFTIVGIDEATSIKLLETNYVRYLKK